MYWFNSVLRWLNTNSGAITGIATGVIAWFTITLANASKSQAKLISDQIKLAREAIELGNREFISTHRPKLRVRRFRSMLDPGGPIAISYVVVNVGGTAAHIKKIDTQMWGRTPDGRELLPKLLPQEPMTLASGQSWLLIDRATEVADDIRWATVEIRGTIDYMDDNGLTRQTGFWRVAGTGPSRLIEKGDPEYEYED